MIKLVTIPPHPSVYARMPDLSPPNHSVDYSRCECCSQCCEAVVEKIKALIWKYLGCCPPGGNQPT